MTRTFAAPPLFLGTTPITTAKGVPKHIAVPGVAVPNRYSIAGGFVAVGGNDVVGGNGYGSMLAVGDWAEYDVILPANDAASPLWAIGATFFRGPNIGICTVKVDGGLALTVDGYVSVADRAQSYFAYTNGAGPGNLTTTRPKKVTVRLDVTGKNASSGQPYLLFLGFMLYQAS